jgi:hypothetical protein
MPKTAAQLQLFAVNCLWISSFVVGNHHLIAGEVNFKYYSRPSIIIHMEYKTGMAVVPCTLAIKEYLQKAMENNWLTSCGCCLDSSFLCLLLLSMQLQRMC